LAGSWREHPADLGREYDQIYVPFVNWTMMLGTLAVTVEFDSSDCFSSVPHGVDHYTARDWLLYNIMQDVWRWSAVTVSMMSGVSLIVDFAFFDANLLKVCQGDWFPLLFGARVFTLVTAWLKKRGGSSPQGLILCASLGADRHEAFWHQ
jgi:KUP system potassium uptake protein